MTLYYSDDKVTLYLGDCREVTEWLAADVLVCDPPYGIGWKKGQNNAAGSRAHEGIANDSDTSVRDAAVHAWGSDKPGVWFGSFYAPPVPGAFQWLVFGKGGDAGIVGSTVGFRRDVEPVFLTGRWPRRSPEWSSILPTQRGTSATASATGHPHTKPLDVMEQLIAKCPPGVIADPFAGSGSTLVAARNLGRKAIGVELEERYAEVIAKRLAQDCLDLGGAS